MTNKEATVWQPSCNANLNKKRDKATEIIVVVMAVDTPQPESVIVHTDCSNALDY